MLLSWTDAAVAICIRQEIQQRVDEVFVNIKGQGRWLY
ncbi:hypothetical protein AVDCRST_MAG94-6248 [uncultured Leptolyngbya sp.]|uniref:Uncharacterized protein n=1 Tax=uncultured Leptolyngbya sp. TaxID=332963 RepID=A0A6J4P8K9_9CYAN|nr:hypothetical protein AVDCRST_MAG94-6248 [uncultured Leptolyngbya sp.]